MTSRTSQQHAVRRTSPLLAGMTAAACALVLAGNWAVAGEDDSNDGAIRFRRVMVPEGRRNDWPVGDARHLPVKPDRFEKLVTTARAASLASEAPRAARITEARYTARFDETRRVLVGEAALSVEQAAERVALLPLEPMDLPISDARWQADPPRDAELGLSADGRLELLVEQPGTLRFDWSLRAQNGPEEPAAFRLKLAPAVVSRLSISLPEGCRPVAEGALIRRARSDDDRGDGDVRQQWDITFGGRREVTLRIERGDDEQQPRRPLTLLRESLTYDISVHGLELLTEWRLEVHDEPLGVVDVYLDRPLKLVAARLDDEPVPWTILEPGTADGQEAPEGDAADRSSDDGPSNDASDGHSHEQRGRPVRVRLTLPTPIEKSSRTLRLGALAPLRMDDGWQLPRVQPVNLAWQEGNATLLVEAPMELIRLATNGCRQSAVGGLSAPREGESMQFQFFQADAALEVTLGRRQAVPEVVSLTHVHLGEEGLTAEVAAELMLDTGTRFGQTARIAPGWLIDRVATVPEDAIEDWVVKREEGGERLIVELRQPVTAARPLQFLVRARRMESPMFRSLAVQGLAPIELLDVDHRRRLLALTTRDDFALEYETTDPLPPEKVAQLDLPEALTDLVPSDRKPLLLDHDRVDAGQRISLVRQRPTFRTEIDVHATCDRTTLTESYRVRCIPGAKRLDRLVVRLGRERTAPLEWHLADHGPNALQATRLRPATSPSTGVAPRRGEDARNTEDSPPQGEAWEIRLREPRNEPFVLLAERTSEFVESIVPSLASTPAASRQTGRLELDTQPGAAVRVEHGDLRPLADLPEGNEPRASRRIPTRRGAYRYEPRHHAAPNRTPIVLRREPSDPRSAAWIWQAWLDSRYESDGHARHAVTYHVENAGRTQLRIVFPEPLAEGSIVEYAAGTSRAVARWAELAAPKADARELRITAGNIAGTLLIDLPRDERFVTVSLLFSTPPASLGVLGHLEPPWPRPDAEVFETEWSAWLPPPYRAASSVVDAAPSSNGVPGDRPEQRLFGPLARRPGAGPLNPLRWRDWQNLLGDATEAAGDERFLPLATKMQAVRRVAEPWSPPQQLGHEPADMRGWMRVTVDAPASASTSIRYWQTHTMTLLGTVAFMIVVAVVWSTLRNRPRVVAAAAGLAGIVALSLPAALAPIGSGIVLGLLFCLAFRLVHSRLCGQRRVRTADADDESPETVSQRLVTVGASVLLALSTLFSTPWDAPTAHADEATRSWQPNDATESAKSDGATPAASSSPGTPRTQPEPYRVFIPVDKERRPTNAPYLIPEPFYQHLMRASTAREHQPRGWLLGKAVYHGDLRPRSAAGPLAVDQVNVSMTLHVLSAPTQVRVPLQREWINLLPEGVRLDGIATESEWAPDGRALLVNVDTPGEYRLEFDVRPRPTGNARGGPADSGSTDSVSASSVTANGGFRMPVPPLPSARLELTVPTAAPQIEVPTAVGPMRWEEGPIRAIASLGPTDEIVVHWRDGLGTNNGSAFDVERYAWLHVHPGSVMLDVHLRLKMLEGRLRSVRLLADPRLRLLPIEGGDAPTIVAREPLDDVRRITLRWSEPATGDRTLQLRFLVTGASGLGKLRLPKVRLSAGRMTRDWLGVSVDDALQFDVNDTASLEAVPIPEFIAGWSTPEGQSPATANANRRSSTDTVPPPTPNETPTIAFRLVDDEPEWLIATRPRAPESTSDERWTCTVGRTATDVRLFARLTTSAGYNFRYRIAAPRSLEVDRVSLLADDVEHVARWARDRHGAVNVFLDTPVSGSAELLIEGRLPHPDDARFPLPWPTIEGVERTSLHVDLLRRPEVLVSIETADNSPLQPALMPEPTLDAERLTRPVASYRLDTTRRPDAAEHPALKVQVKPNRPVVTGRQVVHLAREDEQWLATLEGTLDVADGRLDQFVVAGPSDWLAAPQLSEGLIALPMTGPASLPAEPERSSGAGRLVVRPETPITGHLTFRITAPVAVTAEQPIAAASIRVLGHDALTRLMVVPRTVSDRPLAWHVDRMRRVRLADAVPRLAADASRRAAFRVEPDLPGQPAIQFNSPPTIDEQGRVVLADVYATAHADGSIRGLAVFDVVAGADGSLPLILPERYRLDHATVDDVRCYPRRRGSRRWEVPLRPDGTLQRVAVWYGREPSDGDASPSVVQSPQVEPMPVGQTLWTIAAPVGRTIHIEDDDAGRRASELSLLRLERLTQAMIGTRSLSADTSATPGWYAAWVRRWVAGYQAARRAIANDPAADDDMQQRLNAALARQRDLAERLEQQPTLRAQLAADHWTTEPSALWRAAHADRPLDHAAADGPLAIATPARRARAQHAIHWALAAVLWVLATVAIIIALRRGWLGELFRRWPQAVVVAFGTAWWLWLSPSVLGLLLVVASTATAVRSLWPVLTGKD